MTNEMIKEILLKIKENKLDKYFKNSSDLENWLLSLNMTQANNFLNLKITKELLESIPSVILDLYMLSQEDYLKRIDAISKIKTKDTTFYLLEEVLKNKNFIDNPKYYYDIEILSRANYLKYILIPLNNVDFLNSKYHKQDLELILNIMNKEDYLQSRDICDALSYTASSSNSLNSKYHKEDMNIIANTDKSVVSSLAKLATSEVSLEDKHHQENMYIIIDNQEISEILTKIMTNSSIVNSKNYRKEIQELCNAKSLINAIALYYYIYNPKNKYWSNNDLNIRKVLADYRDNYEKIFMQNSIGTCTIEDNAPYQDGSEPIIIIKNNSIKKKNNDLKQKYVNLKENNTYNYLEGLEIIKQTPDDRVFHIVSLLMNPLFYQNKSSKEIIKLLLKTNPISFNYLYVCITYRDFLNKENYMDVAKLITKTENQYKMSFLECLLDDNKEQTNPNLIYDLNFISNMDDNECTNNEKITKLLDFMATDKSNLEEHKQRINEILESNEEVKSEVELYIDKILNSESPNNLITQKSTPLVGTSKKKRRVLDFFNKNK